MSDKQKNNDIVYWLIALGLIFTGIAAPAGVLMMVLKVLSGGKKKGRHPYYSQRQDQTPMGARTAQTAPPQPAPVQSPPVQATPRRNTPNKRPVKDPVSLLERKGKGWAIAGGSIAAGCFLGFLSSLGDSMYWLFQGDIAFFLQELTGPLVLLCLTGGGLGWMWAGLRKRKQAKRYRNYLAMIGRNNTMSVSALSSATGRSPAKVREDLADMLDDGLFPQGYLDYGGDRLVISGAVTEPAEEPPAPKEDENAVLAEIRSVNNAIRNEKMSAQIDRVGVITAKILDYQKSHPARAPQLHSFLSYYLPTTLKILRAYGQLEAQEVAGENITAAMGRIEGMMDKVVEGFEKQLDLLFQGDAMDITADVEVLERMLAKDGLSEREGITLQL